MKPVKGFDASHYQGLIDHEKVAKAGYEFEIAKATEGGLHGSNIVDPYFVKNFEGAKKAGIQFHAYHFFRGISENDARDEADRFITTLKTVKFDGYAFCDVEAQNLSDKPADLTRYVNAFFEHMQMNGFKKLGIYCNLNFYKNRLIIKDLKPGILFWIAHPSKTPPTGVKCDIWQCGTGRISGIVGPCDEDYSYTSLIGKSNSVSRLHPVLQEGSKGSDVKVIQKILGITQDGDFGPITKKSVEEFQKAHGLTVDGIVGPHTWKALEAPKPVEKPASKPTEKPAPEKPATKPAEPVKVPPAVTKSEPKTYTIDQVEAAIKEALDKLK